MDISAGSGSKRELRRAPAEAETRFLTWFSRAINRFQGLLPGHMNAVRAWMKHSGVPDPATASRYDRALAAYGLKLKPSELKN